jgi:hypothetical protein
MNVTDARRLIATELSEVHTCLPGEIVSYDGKFAVVKPTLAKKLANGETLAAPQIVKVPVCWPCADMKGAKAYFTMPLKAGDPVQLNFSERALEDWLGGDTGAPGDPRQFDLSDAFATPMHVHGFEAADTENVSLGYGPMTMKISPEGEITIDTVAKITATTTADVLVQTSANATVEAGAVATVRAPMVISDALNTVTTGNLEVGGYLTFGATSPGPGPRAQMRGPVELIDGPLYSNSQDVIMQGKSLAGHTHLEHGAGSQTDPPT